MARFFFSKKLGCSIISLRFWLTRQFAKCKLENSTQHSVVFFLCTGGKGWYLVFEPQLPFLASGRLFTWLVGTEHIEVQEWMSAFCLGQILPSHT